LTFSVAGGESDLGKLELIQSGTANILFSWRKTANVFEITYRPLINESTTDLTLRLLSSRCVLKLPPLGISLEAFDQQLQPGPTDVNRLNVTEYMHQDEDMGLARFVE